MVTVKLLHLAPTVERRLTTGQISTGVLYDEDYVEVALEQGFKPTHRAGRSRLAHRGSGLPACPAWQPRHRTCRRGTRHVPVGAQPRRGHQSPLPHTYRVVRVRPPTLPERRRGDGAGGVGPDWPEGGPPGASGLRGWGIWIWREIASSSTFTASRSAGYRVQRRRPIHRTVSTLRCGWTPSRHDASVMGS